MRGDDRQSESMFSYVSAEQRVPKDHPLRAVRALVDESLRDMSTEFDENRHGLVVDAMATTADGTAERDAALLLLEAQPPTRWPECGR